MRIYDYGRHLGIAALALCAGCSPTSHLADLDARELRDEPVMFSVTDADSEIILYGTFHLLPPGLDWQSETLDAALARSDEVWFELPKDAQADPALGVLTMQLGMAQTPLSSRLDEDAQAQMKRHAETLGIPMATLDRMQPWLAAITLPMLRMRAEGFDPSAGAEAMLEPRVETLPRRALETAEQQLRILAGLSETDQLDMLAQTLEGLDEDPDLFDRMAQGWATGDVDYLEEEVVDAAKRDAPAMYEALFTRRNADWAEQLDAEMQGEGVDFVAVGAGHLLGPDSVPVLMAAKGYEVRVLTRN